MKFRYIVKIGNTEIAYITVTSAAKELVLKLRAYQTKVNGKVDTANLPHLIDII